jgi:phosphoglycolate phosphatase-like HAD superfamily hydrolase
MRNRFLLFLDFDGVICDSALECYKSSLSAYNLAIAGTPPHTFKSDKYEFDLLRPYVRNSEDYLFIQEIIHKRIKVKSQSDFDAHIAVAPADKRSFYRKSFYDIRTSSFASDPKSWLNSNPIFPHMKEPLLRYCANPRLFILSTKKGEFIEAILSHNGIALDRDRIISSKEQERKLDHIGEALDSGKGEKAIFVDDQIDHLKGNNDTRIAVCLPLWGYIEKSCFDVAGVIRVINQHDMIEIFSTIESGD